MLEATGLTARVMLDGQFVTISRSGRRARRRSVGEGEKRILVASITAVQWHPARRGNHGFIEFTLPGGNEVVSQRGHRINSAARNENAVVFKSFQQLSFERIRKAVEQAIQAHHSPAAPPTPDVPGIPDQIASLAQLRDAGVLSEDEFQAKKSQLLERM